MTTYKITGTTNPYIAQRDIHFNGETTIEIDNGLTVEQAKKKLEEMFCEDYENAIHISSLEDYIYELYYSLIEEQSLAVGNNDIESYYQQTKKRWEAYYNAKVNYDERHKYEGPGYYSMSNYFGRLFSDGAEAYEYDSRSYGIHEETEESEDE
jgi:hypothetical protein